MAVSVLKRLIYGKGYDIKHNESDVHLVRFRYMSEKEPARGEDRGILPGSGDSQGEQKIKSILPSYIKDRTREVLSKRFVPNKEFLEQTGWNSFAEFLFDVSDNFPKPEDPSIPDDDMHSRDESNSLKSDMTADWWEEEIVDKLKAQEDAHLVRQFKQEMQEYRKSVKAIVQLWRERGLL